MLAVNHTAWAEGLTSAAMRNVANADWLAVRIPRWAAETSLFPPIGRWWLHWNKSVINPMLSSDIRWKKFGIRRSSIPDEDLLVALQLVAAS